MSDKLIHVMPVTTDHIENADGTCWCAPLRTNDIGGYDFIVHRYPSDKYVDPSPFVPFRMLDGGKAKP